MTGDEIRWESHGPVAPAEAIAALAGSFDDIICLEKPEPFYGVGAWYQDFHQLSDEEVIKALREYSVDC